MVSPKTALNAALVLCIAGVVLLVGTRSITFGSVPGGWTYPYIAHLRVRPVAMALALSLVLIPLTDLCLRLIDRHQISVLCLWLVVATAIQLLLHSLYIYSIADVVTSGDADTFYEVSLKSNPYDFLVHNHEVAKSLPPHVRANMPGKVLLFHFLRLISEDPRTLGILILVVSNLGGLFLYFLVSEIFDSRAIGLSSLILYFFIPARIYFLPLLNLISPIPVLAGLWSFQRLLSSHRPVFAVLLAACLYAAVFFDPLPLALGLFFGALLLRSFSSGETKWLEALRLGSLTLAVLVVIHFAMLHIFHYDIVRGLNFVAADAREFYRVEGRPYAVWLYANLGEFFLGAGVLPSLLVFAYGALRLSQSLRQPGQPACVRLAERRLKLAGPLMLVTLLLTLTVLDLSGAIRGEVTRLWIFLMIFVQVVAAAFCFEKGGRWTLGIVAAGSIIQTAVTISKVGFILVFP